MDTERWAQIERLFHDALEQPTLSRSDWLQQECGADQELLREVRMMLASDAAGASNIVESGIREAVILLDQEDQLPKRTRVGPYSILREIGRGGMGRVYLAQRDDGQYQAQVALKVVRPGMDSRSLLARFRQERQTLARLQHPNIARLLDGGSTNEGLPYLVMEYIDGEPITVHCRNHDLSMDARVRLFLDVCLGVEYAHLCFVVHRDIKPGNILIDGRGAPKILDFGICKLLDESADTEQTIEQRTRGMEMMTPDYASPEQVRGEAIAVASDVYSLGAVLYELLTGARPHRLEKLTPVEVERSVCEKDILRPSAAAEDKRLARQLEGDLDNILLKALQKEPARRYASAARLADDLRRHLNHLPVEARPDSAAYRVSKFLERHRVGVGATAAVVLALSIGIVISVREARRAEASLRQARHFANTFVVDVHDAISALPGATKARELVARKAAEQLDQLSRLGGSNLDLDKELAVAYMRVGDVQGNVVASNLGDIAAARESYGKAVTLLESVLRRKPDDRDTAATMLQLYLRLGSILVYSKGTRQGQETFEKGLRLGQSLLQKSPRDPVLRARVTDLAVAGGEAQRLGDHHDLALASSTLAYGLARDLAAEFPNDRQQRVRLADAASALGMAQARFGRATEALQVYRQAVAEMEELHRLDPSNVNYSRNLMFAYSHVGDVLGGLTAMSLGDRAGTREVYEKMAGVARQLYEADRNDQRALGDYGIALMRTAATVDDPNGKLKYLHQSKEILERALAANENNKIVAVNLAFVLERTGTAYDELGERAEALPYWKQSMKRFEILLDAQRTTPARVLTGLYRRIGEYAARSGNRAEAIAYMNKALRLGEESAKESEGDKSVGRRDIQARAYGSQAGILAALGDIPQARVSYEKSLALWAGLKAREGFLSAYEEEYRRTEKAFAAFRRK